MRKTFLILIVMGAIVGWMTMSQAEENPIQVSKKGLYRVEMAIEGQKLKVGANRAELVIRDNEGKPVAGALVRILPLIYQHGESTLMKPRVTEKDKGHYQVENMFIEIEGHWVLKISMKKGALEDEVIFDFPEVKKGPS